MAVVRWSGVQLAGPRARFFFWATHSFGRLLSGVSAWTYLLNQAVMIVRYLCLAVWPTSLVVNYGWPVPLTLGEVLPQALIVVTLLVGTIAALMRRPPLGLPGRGIFHHAGADIEHRAHRHRSRGRAPACPLIPIVILLVIGGVRLWTSLSVGIPSLSRLMPKRAPGSILLAAMAMLLATATIAANREYGSSLLMAQTVVVRYPTSYAHHKHWRISSSQPAATKRQWLICAWRCQALPAPTSRSEPNCSSRTETMKPSQNFTRSLKSSRSFSKPCRRGNCWSCVRQAGAVAGGG